MTPEDRLGELVRLRLSRHDTRRGFLKTALAGAAVASASTACDGAGVEKLLGKHYLKLTDEDKRQIFARIEAEALKRSGVRVTVGDPQPIWVERGMGLVLPGFTPSPLGEVVEYVPNASEIVLMIGILAAGALLFTAAAKVTIAVQTGRLRFREGEA